MKQRIILVTFAGRRDRMELLTWYARAALDRGLLDEWHVWDFVRNMEDRAWLRQQFPVVRMTPSARSGWYPSGDSIPAGPALARYHFSVSGYNDIHVGLCRRGGAGAHFEIAVGGWVNTVSVIRVFAEREQLLRDDLRGEANEPAVSESTPGVLPEYQFVELAIELSEDGLAVFVGGALVICYDKPILPGEFDILYRSGYGCNAEWRFPSWPEKGAFLYQGARQSNLLSQFHPSFENLPPFGPFYQHYGRHAADYADAVFLKCDDDIVFMDLNRLPEFIAYRLTHPEYFIVSANVINNGICAYYQQQDGLIPKTLMALELPPGGYGGSLWESSEKAELMHRYFLENTEAFLSLEPHAFTWNLRFSVNFVSWLGSDLVHFSELMLDDEEYICYQARWHSRKDNVIFAPFVVAHLSFLTQDKTLDVAGVLEGYKALAARVGVGRKYVLSQMTQSNAD